MSDREVSQWPQNLTNNNRMVIPYGANSIQIPLYSAYLNPSLVGSLPSIVISNKEQGIDANWDTAEISASSMIHRGVRHIKWSGSIAMSPFKGAYALHGCSAFWQEFGPVDRLRSLFPNIQYSHGTTSDGRALMEWNVNDHSFTGVITDARWRADTLNDRTDETDYFSLEYGLRDGGQEDPRTRTPAFLGLFLHAITRIDEMRIRSSSITRDIRFGEKTDNGSLVAKSTTTLHPKPSRGFSSQATKKETLEWSSDNYISDAVEVWEPRFTLDDIGGHETIKESVKEIALLFKNDEVSEEWEEVSPKGVLFHGPPGTGKTMLAHALAHEMESELWEIDSAKLYDMWMGLSSKNLSELFDRIVSHRGNLVVFFDEIDSILSKHHELGPGGAAADRNQVTGIFKRRLNTISDEKPDLLIVAATNHLEDLDPGIIRDGRFDYKIAVPLPNEAARAQIISNHLAPLIEREKVIIDSLDVPAISQITDGMSGAAIQNIFSRLRRTKAVRQIQTGQPQFIAQGDILNEITRYKTSG